MNRLKIYSPEIALEIINGILRAMPKKTDTSSGTSISEGANARLNLASLRVGLTTGKDSRQEVRAQLIVQPQTITTEQVTGGASQQVSLKIGLQQLQVLLMLEGGEFDFEPAYTVQVDQDTYTMEEKRQNEHSMEGNVQASVEVSTPPGIPIVKGKTSASADAQASRKVSQTETAERRYFLVELDTPPAGADSDRVRRWQIGADGKGGDMEKGLPYLRGDTYLNRDGLPLATFQAQEGANRVAVDVALAIRRDDFHVTCVDADTLVNADMAKVKARLAQIALNRAMQKFDPKKIASAIKDDEILIDMKRKEMDK